MAGLRELIGDAFEVRQGVSIGAVWLLHEVAQRIGITAALGNSPEGRVALWQVLARTLEQGSRLSAVRLAQSHAAGAVLGLEPCTEEHLYANLAWLAQEQRHIEQRL